MGLDSTQFRPKLKDIQEILGNAGEADVDQVLGGLEAEAQVLVEDIDVEALWGLVEAGETYATTELADFAGGASPSQVLALRRALEADSLYFRAVDKGWQARDARLLESLSEQARERDAKAKEHGQEKRWLASALKGSAGRQDAPRGLISRLQDVVLHPNSEDADAFLELLRQTEDEVGEYLPGVGVLKVFELLVRLGVYSKHENLERRKWKIRDHEPRIQDLAAALKASEASRLDLEQEWTFTVDDAQTRDMDDGLSLRSKKDGSWLVGVHIADVSAWVPKGHDLDLDAIQRGTSVYLVEDEVPMFPRVLSHGNLSLAKGERRAALSLLMTFDRGLELKAWEFKETWVRVAERLTYDEVDKILSEESTEERTDRIHTMFKIAEQLRSERESRGARSLELPTSHVELRGEEPVIWSVSDTASRRLVQEFMVAYNAKVAEVFDKANIPAVFRGQEPAEQELEPLEGVAGEFAVLKTMRKSSMGLSPMPHASLGLAAYVQATSPIRRYLDLVHQRQLKSWLHHQALPYEDQELYGVLAEVSESAMHAQEVERASRRYWLLVALGARTNEEFDAIVLDENRQVLLTEFGVIETVSTAERMPLGAKIRVRVDHADARRGELVLTFVHS